MYFSIRQAFLAIKESPVRSVLRVIALFILMASFMACVSIWAGIQEGLSEAQDLKGNEVRLIPDNTGGGNAQNINTADWKKAYVTVGEAQQLLGSPYITNYNFYLWTTAYVPMMSVAVKSSGDAVGTKKGTPERSLLKLCGCTRPDLQSDFKNGGLKLVSGQFFSGGGAGKVIISREFAEKNNLAPGSTFLIEDSKSKTKEEVVVGGVFGEGVAESASTLYGLYMNTIFAPLETVQRINSAAEPGQPEEILTGASFILDDPGHYDAFVDEAKSRGIDMKSFRLEPEDDEYTRATRPLRELDTAMKVLISLIAAIGVVSMFLSGIISLKSMKREISLLRSIGFGKKRIMLRFAAEIAVICCIAYAVAGFAGAAAAPFAADRLMKFQSEEVLSAEQSQESIFIIGDEYKVSWKPDGTGPAKTGSNEDGGSYIDKIHPVMGMDTAVFFISMGTLMFLCRLGAIAYAVGSSKFVDIKTGLEGRRG